jgi:hypothetical protein
VFRKKVDKNWRKAVEFIEQQEPSFLPEPGYQTEVTLRQKPTNSKPVAPPRLKAPSGPICLNEDNVAESGADGKNADSLVEEQAAKCSRNASTDSAISSNKSTQRRPSIEAPPTPLEPLHLEQKPLGPLRLAPERSSLRRQLKSVLTPPLPRVSVNFKMFNFSF